MIEDQWTAVDEYLGGLLLRPDPIQVSLVQGKFLNLQARVQRARKILEVGTLAGYSAIWLGRALPSDGRLISIDRPGSSFDSRPALSPKYDL